MTFSFQVAGKTVHVSNTPPRTAAGSSDASVLKRNRLDAIAIHQLRQLLAAEAGNPVLRYADAVIIEEVIKRLKSSRWSLAVVDMPRIRTLSADEADGDAAGKKGSSKGGPGGGGAKNPTKTWVEVELLDKDKRPVKAAKIEMTLPDGAPVTGALSDHGSYRVDGIDPGTCRVRFPDLDGREWSKSSNFADGAAVELRKGSPKIPAGPYTVKQGDHVASIAHDAGFLSWKTVWDDGKNAAIKAKRNPNVLYPGDVIEIPVLQKKEESVPTGDYHTFQTIGDPVQLKIVVLDWAGNPMVDTEVEVQLDSEETTRTAGDGSVKKNVDPAAVREGTLKLKGFDLALKLGHLDPVEEFSGQLWRLNNLGYRAGSPPDSADMEFKSAVEEFQCDHGLTVDGLCGANTQTKLKEIHGS